MIRRGLYTMACVMILAGLGLSGLASGQVDQPSLDDLLDLAPVKPDAPATQDPDEPQAPGPGPGLDESIKEALSATDAADAFEQAVGEMDHVARRLGRTFDPGVETQRMQESILRKLDQVIESAKQQNSGGGGSGQPQEQDQGAEQLARQEAEGAGKPTGSGQQPSTGNAGSASPVDPEDQDTAIEQLRKEWGVLPPRVREELSDGLRERFSPLYRRMTEAYYEALAEQE